MGGDARSNDEVGADRKTRDTPTLLRELAWVIHRTAPERSGAPLPIAEVALLKEIDDMPGVTVGELAAALGMQQPNVSAALRALERNGFIVREKDASDRRITRTSLTTAGLIEHRAVADAWAEPVSEALAALDDTELALLEAAGPVLERLHQLLQRRL